MCNVVNYQCGSCGFVTPLKASDPIKCRQVAIGSVQAKDEADDTARGSLTLLGVVVLLC